MTFDSDVLIIGGGPAGSTIGTFLSRKGYSVVLLEKEKHPRFHIGESLLPMNLPILERLGVLSEMTNIGVTKLGADFTYSDDPLVYRTYKFERALGESPNHAFEVKRDIFDNMLLNNCKESGVTVHQKHEVLKVELSKAGTHRILSKDSYENGHVWSPRFLVDASGRDALVASTNGWKKKNPKHSSAAIYGHFTGVDRRPGANAGNISVYWFQHGWIWMIPLQGDVMSIGAVCWPDYLKQRHEDTDSFFWKTLALCPAAYKRSYHAKPASKIRVSGNYSYFTTRLYDKGLLLVGDSFAFIDPVFSSGVYLAMNSAEQGVSIVENWLNGQSYKFAFSCHQYRRKTRKGLQAYSWFIYRFTSPAMRSLFKNPRNLLQVEQAVTSMLAGDIFLNRNVKLRLRLFRLIYTISWLLNWKINFLERRRRLRNVGMAIKESDNII